MAAKRPPITETIQQILGEAAGPLSVDEVAAQLEARLPGASKNYKSSVRNSLANNRLGAIMRLPDGRIGLKTRLISGATLRHVLYGEDLAERQLVIGDALADLLEPLRGLPGTGGALRIELEDGQQLLARVDGTLGQRVIDAGPAFWDWLDSRGATAGDSLIVTALDAGEHRYGLRFEPAVARDEAAIAARNAEVLDVALAFLRRQRGRAVYWELVAYLNASGALHNPTPPDPIEDLWTEEVYGPVQDAYGVDFPLTGSTFRLAESLSRLFGGAELSPVEGGGMTPVKVEVGPEDLPEGVSMEEFTAKLAAVYNPAGMQPLADDDPMLPAISAVAARHGLPAPTGRLYKASELQARFGSDDDTLDWIDEGIALGMVEEDEAYDPFGDEVESPADLPTVYEPTGAPRKPQPSPKGRKGPVKTYVLRLATAYEKGFARDIEIAEDQNLEDLHLAIQKALGWDDDHLYSFFIGRRPYDAATEIGSPWSDCPRHTYQVTLSSLGLRSMQKFFYLFDYGDNHLFTLQVQKINPSAPKGSYPKVVGREGKAPRQYEHFDDFDEDDEE